MPELHFLRDRQSFWFCVWTLPVMPRSWKWYLENTTKNLWIKFLLKLWSWNFNGYWDFLFKFNISLGTLFLMQCVEDSKVLNETTTLLSGGTTRCSWSQCRNSFYPGLLALHRNTEQLRLVRSSLECLVYPVWSEQGQLQQAAQGLVQSILNYFQEWRIYNFPVQFTPVFSHPHHKKFPN